MNKDAPVTSDKECISRESLIDRRASFSRKDDALKRGPGDIHTGEGDASTLRASAQTLHTAGHSPESEGIFLPDGPPEPKSRMYSIHRGCLYPASQFRGVQRSGNTSYDVTVEIVSVNMQDSTLGGYLSIRGLTSEWPELTTYFDAEIIGRQHRFVTKRWGATEADDIRHWTRFPAFRMLVPNQDDLNAPFEHDNLPVVFMRWKERFLVPDHRIETVDGASFAGFYYVCVSMQSDYPVTDNDTGLSNAPHTGQMSGYYFHTGSEPFQQLVLEHVPRNSSASYELC